MNQASLLHKVALSFGDRPAVTEGTNCLHTYNELSDRAGRLGAALRGQLGLNKGDRVAIMMKNAPAFFEVLYATWHAGLAAVPINAKLRRPDLFHHFRSGGDHSTAHCGYRQS